MPLFDDKAASYDDFCKTLLGHFVDKTERDILASLAEPIAGEQVIDLGCGTGVCTAWLLAAGTTVTGVDISSAMLEVARQKFSSGVTFEETDLARLPFADASFDLAVTNVVLEFTSDPKAILQEAYRVLKPGGRLVVGFIGKDSPWGMKYQQKGQADPTSVYHNARFFTHNEAAALGWNQPAAARFGLFIGPDEFVDKQQAERLELDRSQLGPSTLAGFFALRWEKTVRPER